MIEQVELRAYDGYQIDGAAIVSLWNAAMGEDFPMDIRLWRQNMDDDPNFDASGVLLGFVEGKLAAFVVARVPRVPMGLQPTPVGKGWINSLAVDPGFQRRGFGARLLQQAEAWLRERNVAEISVGGDVGHFFPGVPFTAEVARAFFPRQGYQAVGDPCWDLKCDIREFQIPTVTDRVMARNLPFRITQCTNNHVPALLDFLRKTFPGRWLYETQLRLEQERSPQDITILLIGNRVVGFAHTFHGGSLRLGPSVYWRKLLGPNYGGLGPIGVSEDVRKTGLGFALLCGSIERLKNLGVVNMAIDWTTLLKFYGAAGFMPYKEYRAYRRRL